MKQKLNRILLVDDDSDDNYFHQIIINEMNIVNQVDVVHNGLEALAYLKDENLNAPDIIFLDINMPKMNGWEFLEKYKQLDMAQKAKVLIVILTTSANPADLKKAQAMEYVTGFTSKPLTEELLKDLLQKHFKDLL